MIRFGYAFVALGVIGGCASVLPDNSGTVPAWFETRREEVIKEGYPSLTNTVSLRAEGDLAPWEKIASDLERSQREFREADAGAVATTASEIRAWAEAQRSLVAKGEEPY